MEKERTVVPGGLRSRYYPLQAPPKKRRLSIAIGFINKASAGYMRALKCLSLHLEKLKSGWVNGYGKGGNDGTNVLSKNIFDIYLCVN